MARALARAGVASRREAERLIEAGRISLNGQVLTSPAVNLSPGDILTLDGNPIADKEPARLWRYHKPAGLITTHNDPKGRATVFDRLPKTMPRVISIGRLDLNSEGLLLLTNDGALARTLEMPSSGVVRRYRARAFGRVTQPKLDTLKAGLVVEGVVYGAIEAELERGSGSNIWIGLSLAEGKNREVRKVLEAIGLKVNRLIRTSYGPFALGELKPGEVEEVPPRQVQRLLEGDLITQDAPPAKPRAAGRGEAPGKTPTGRAKPGKPRAAAGTSAAIKERRRTKTWAATTKRPSTAKSAAPAAGAESARPQTYKPGWAKPKKPFRHKAKTPSRPRRTPA